MTTRILFAARPERWDDYRDLLPAALDAAGIAHTIDLFEAPHDPAQIDYVIYAPNAALQDFTPYTGLKAVLNLWAGVEEIEGNRTLTAPLTRMVDPSLTQGMVEWVTGHVLRHHLGMDAHIHGAPWDNTPPPLASDRPVTILGLGTLGSAAARALTALGFPVTGWSRSAKDIPGVRSLTGEEGLRKALSEGQITVLLTPHTRTTENLLNADRLSLMPKGAVLLNPGRGALVDDDALLAALDGHLGHATLDAFRVEPLPEDHPYWHHPNVTVTPHIASATRAPTAVHTLAEIIRCAEAGAPLPHLVDRTEALT
ncbi:glyoxylate/hydroxypyruvate reductase A [Jannaschia pagri]|uniref:Glyoxylate/hydroxypyruvate reductase A n=1 Tax=Jannaschia pagri TaxID=2829797 RepID=A0ABQ4NKG0_9RHOB|nr:MULTISPECIES: glyoxylate/hydroxypyruvate reductase A [unclassified Jannaschia]GIT91060.1 glyoxylate/hydroxypyruvate reductase A [Jannaschia sp. AI_61]GIT94892.1 glyoxylate/hydroxypyruvate reductase A [Jannaschia sp. AI_62]